MSDHIAGVVLAAGLSRRMAPHNKLLLKGAAGEAMVVRAVDALLASKVASIWVVLGHQAAQVASALGTRRCHLVHARDYAAGLAASLASGIAALPPDAAAALICLGDMPDVGAEAINIVLDAYDPGLGRLIIVPTHVGQRGNPVLWDRRFFSEILSLNGDRGARLLMPLHAEEVFEVSVQTPGVLVDYDTPDTLTGPM